MANEDNIDGPVDVNIATADGPRMISHSGGAIQITVGGERVNKFEDEDELEWGEWDPQYVGDFLAVDLPDLLDITTQLYRGELQQYATEIHQLAGYMYYFLFEPVGEAVVRIAFQTRERPAESDLGLSYPTPRSARGYVVDSEALCRAMLAAFKEFERRASRYEVSCEEFEEKIDEVEFLLSE